MNTAWLRPNAYIVQNGRLVPRPSTPEHKKNYRYVHFDPLNNPAPEDYFRETISRLQKQNTSLKAELTEKLQQDCSRIKLADGTGKHEEQRKYEAHIAALIQELARKEHELEDKNQQLTNRDKRILELGNQNTRLHLRINGVVKQIEALNLVMSKKDEQIQSKKQQIQQYCRTLQKFTLKEKEQEKTMFSENQLTTPRIQQREDEEDQFYSMDYNSLYDRHSLDRRYMTPDIQGFRLQDARNHLYQSQHQIQIEETQQQYGRDSRRNNQQDKGNSESNELNWNLKNWSQWASQPNIKTSLSYDLLKQQANPVSIGQSNIIPSRK